MSAGQMYQLEWVQQRATAARNQARAQVRLDGVKRPVVSSTVWLLGITSLLTDVSSEMVNGILPLYLVGFLHLSPLQFGVIDGLYQGVSAFVRLAGGLVADRWRRYKETAAAGYALSAICKLGLLTAGASWPAIAGVVALDRTGKGLRTAPRDALITLSSDRATLGTSFGVHRAMDAAGALIGPVVAFLILANAPNAFDLVFVVSFSVAVVGVAVLLLFVEPSRARAAATPDAHSPRTRDTIREVFRQTGFGFLVLAASLLSLATVSDAFIYLTLQQRLAFAPGVFPLLYVATSLVYMAAAVPAGRLADRFGRRTVFAGGYVLMAAIYLLLLTPSTGPAGAAVAIVALGAYYAATDGVLMALAGRLLPPAACATGLALLTTFTTMSRLLSSLAFGWIWTTRDVGGAISVFGVALIIALGIAIVALRRVNEEPA